MRTKWLWLWSLVLVLALAVTACGGEERTQPTESATQEEAAGETQTNEPRVVRLLSHDSFSISEEVVAAFEAEHNATIEFVKGGDTGTMLNQAILSKENPLADVIFGVDNTFLSRALDADMTEPYVPAGLEQVPDDLKLDPQNRLVPIDWGDVCLNIDKEYFAANNLPKPRSLRDLTKPEYKGLTVVENPATSSPGLAFMLTTIGAFGTEGDDTWEDFWREMRANDVLVTDGWEDAYYGQFSGGSGEGTRPIVVSYATSPVAEVYFADPQPEEAPTEAIVADNTCFRQIEFAGLLKNAANPDLGKALLDFMLSPTFQEDIPLQMFVFPARPDVELPEVFVKHGVVAEKPAVVPPEDIEAHREEWIERWTEIVLR
nr:thiamine ABC transporter substrate-binding protein [Ardenticatena sp.]